MYRRVVAIAILAALIWPTSLALATVGAEQVTGQMFGVSRPSGGEAPEPWSPPERAGLDATITVTTTDDELNADGDCSLREAIEAANTDGPVDACVPGSGDDIVLAPAGSYVLSIDGAGEDANQTGDLDILGNMVIEGDGMEMTSIDGGALDRIFQVHPGRTVEIKGLTVTNGHVHAGYGGGGVLNRGFLSLRSVVLRDNLVTTDPGWNTGGGGLSNDALFGDASANLNDCLVTGNSAPMHGGLDTVADSGLKATLTLHNTAVEGNSAEMSGGGIGSSWYIGAIDPQPMLFIGSSTISGNTVSGSGFATGLGGGVFAGGQATLINSTVSGNQAAGSGLPDISGLGGGVFVGSDTVHSSLSMASCTVAGNSSAVSGGGVFVGHLGPGASFEAQNSIVGGNSAPEGLGESCSTHDWGYGPGVFTSLGHNLEDHDFCGFHQPGDMTHTDPLLGLLGNYGGPTETHLLLAGSLAVDAGETGEVPEMDQRGVPRPQGPASDIGAYEAEAVYASRLSLRARDVGGGRYILLAAVEILTQGQERLVEGDVQGVWTMPNGMAREQWATTNDRGLARFRIGTRQAGTFAFCVTDVVKDGYTYDPTLGMEPCRTVEVPL